MSTLKVNTIQDTTGNDALTIDSSGNVTASQGFVPPTQLGHRNLIINGDFQVWQRGTSFSSAVNGQYVVDRGQTFGSGITCVVDRSTDVPANQGFKYSFKINRTANGLPIYRQRIEDFSTLISGRTVTLSFWAKAATTTNIDVDIGDNDSSKATFTLTTSWQKFTQTYAAYSSYTFDGLDIQNNSVSTTMYFTGIQLEVGTVATPFEHRSFGEELARCQRYYCKSYDYDVVPGTANEKGGAVFVYRQRDNNYCAFYFQHPVTMRTTPTQTRYSLAGTSGKGTSSTTDFTTSTNSQINGDSASMAYGTGTPADDCYQHFVLDAEL